jgi:sulfite exporter TauE/SafE
MLINLSLIMSPSLQLSNESWLSFIPLTSLGFVLGLRHALEADHVAAVSTIATEHKNLLKSSLVGALWGAGHTISLLLAGILVFLIKFEISEKLAQKLEFGVALMLIGLGVNALYKLFTSKNFVPHTHSGENKPHTHLTITFASRPIVIGMMHGLAGSAALILLVIGTTKSAIFGLAYIAIFGLGSILGMLLMSLLISLPIYFTSSRFTRLNLLVRALAGVFSFGCGLLMVYEIGFVEGLF